MSTPSTLAGYLTGAENPAKFNDPNYRLATVTTGNSAAIGTNTNTAIITLGSTTGIVAKTLIPVVAADNVWCVQMGNEILIVSHIETGWHYIGQTGEPAFTNGWLNFDPSLYPGARFRKSNGIVEVQGLVKDGTINTIAFILPAGYRPSRALHRATLSNNLVGGVRIYETGAVVLGNPGTNVWHSIDQMFTAEQ